MICFYVFLNGRSLTAYQYKLAKNNKTKINRIGSINFQEAEADNHDSGLAAKNKQSRLGEIEIEQDIKDLESSKLNLIGIQGLSADEEDGRRSPPRHRKKSASIDNQLPPITSTPVDKKMLTEFPKKIIIVEMRTAEKES